MLNMIPCESVQFSRPITVDRGDPRAGYQTGGDTRLFWSEHSGQVAIVVGGKASVVVPPEGTVIRGLRWPAEEKANGQQQPVSSDSSPPARPIPKSGRVQR